MKCEATRMIGDCAESINFVVATNFNKIYRIAFNYFKNNSVRIAY